MKDKEARERLSSLEKSLEGFTNAVVIKLKKKQQRLHSLGSPYPTYDFERLITVNQAIELIIDYLGLKYEDGTYVDAKVEGNCPTKKSSK